MVGIYKITNKINGKCYYGSSKNIEKRWIQHKKNLNNNKHINIIIQRAWNKYGEDNFQFDIIEECDKDFLYEIEQKYLNLSPEYNIGINASGGDNLTNNPNKKDIVLKITKSMINRYKTMTKEEIDKQCSKPKERNPNWKNGITYCKCGNKKKNLSKTCNKCRDRRGELNPFYGKTHTQKTKTILSKSKEGKYYGKQNLPILIDNIEYRSAGEASKILKIPMITIRWRVISKNKKFNNYMYKSDFQEHYLDYWTYVKDVIDKDGWVYSKDVPYLLDAYFETNTGQQIEFQKTYPYEGNWRGYRWRPKSILNVL